MSKHALLSASSSRRWLNCPPSARLCESYEDKGSDYAAEGTDAHSLCEFKLKTALGMEAQDPTENLSYYSEEMEDCATLGAYVLELVRRKKIAPTCHSHGTPFTHVSALCTSGMLFIMPSFRKRLADVKTSHRETVRWRLYHYEVSAVRRNGTIDSTAQNCGNMSRRQRDISLCNARSVTALSQCISTTNWSLKRTVVCHLTQSANR